MPRSSLITLLEAFASELIPPPVRTVSEWAAENRILRSDYAAEPGKWRPERTPYLVEPMNRLGPQDPTLEIVMVAATQLGKTTIPENYLGYCVDCNPGPMMMVQPNVEKCRTWIRKRIVPMIEDCPSIRDKFDKRNDPEGLLTTLIKHFEGGTVEWHGANSSSSARSESIRDLFMDETDAMKFELAGEGDPLDLFAKRTDTFGPRAKRYFSSTPTVEDTSHIWKKYLRSDQRRFWILLPCCNTRQLLKFENIRPPHKNPLGKTVYQCPHCQQYVEERTKTAFLTTGRWAPWIEEEEKRAIVLDMISSDLGREIKDVTWEITSHPIWVENAQPTKGMRIGYHINGLYSPLGWVSWDTIWKEFVDAEGDPALLQVFINTRLAEVWKGLQGDRVEKNLLTRFCSGYKRGTVPDEVAVLTAGVDVQDDRLEGYIYGWGKYRSPWYIDRTIIPGDPEDDRLWETIDEMLQDKYDGMGIRAGCVDTGGHHTDKVYLFCKSRFKRNIWAIKGSSKATDPVWPNKSTKTQKYSTNLYLVGVHQAKFALFQRLKKEAGENGCFHFPIIEVEEEDEWENYFDQLTSEQLVKYRKNGRWMYRFDNPKNKRNEAWDDVVYAYAALIGLEKQGLKIDKELEKRLELRSKPQTPIPVSAPRGNSFLQRRTDWLTR